MKLTGLVYREFLWHRKYWVLSFMSRILLVALFICSNGFSGLYDYQAALLADREISALSAAGDQLQEGYRKGTLEYSYNLILLPDEKSLRQWRLTGESDQYFDAGRISELAQSRLVWIRHLLPVLQKTVLRTESGDTLLLVGTRGEATADHGGVKEPLIRLVKPGEAVVGYEVAKRYGISVGETFELNGRRFLIAEVYPARGNRDDLSFWVDLEEAQRLLELPGQINAALALECVCADSGSISAEERIREEVQRYLPGFSVSTMSRKSLSRKELREQADARVSDLRVSLLQRRLEQAKQREEAVQLFQTVGSSILIVLSVALFFSFAGSAASYFTIYRRLGFSRKRIGGYFFLRTSVIAGGGIAGGSLVSAVVMLLFLLVTPSQLSGPGIWNPAVWFSFSGLLFSLALVSLLDIAGVILIVLRSRLHDRAE